MSLGLFFWVVWLVWIIFGVWPRPVAPGEGPYYRYGYVFIVALLFFVVGWRVFGFIIH